MTFEPQTAEQRFVLDHIVGIADLTADTEIVEPYGRYERARRKLPLRNLSF